MRRVRLSLAALTATALLTACSGGTQPQSEGTGSAPAASPKSSTSPTPTESAGTGLTPVPFDDAPRELTELEQSLMVEPGPLAAEDSEEDVLAAAQETSNPTTAEEWIDAILAQIHGDYAENVKTVVRFDPGTGERGEGPAQAGSGTPDEQSVGTNHFALVLDASSSMAQTAGNGTRMDEARESLAAFADELPDGSSVSLRVYGHAGDDTAEGKAESCATTEVLYSGTPDGLGEALADVQPTGFTPLAKGIEDAASDIPDNATDGIVYVVTDGLETCGGDPVAAAKELSTSGIEPVINVLGFQAGDADQAALAAIAAAGGGKYTQANSRSELDDYWRQQNRDMLAAWNEWRSAELAAINAASSDNKKIVNEVATELKRSINDEASLGKKTINLLRGEIDESVRTEVWLYFENRRTKVWNWAESTRSTNWLNAENTRLQDWTAVYNRAQTKWTEYFEELQGN